MSNESPKILTEEDLERIRYKYTQSHFGGRNSYSIIDGEIANLIASHRLLLSANAELSFKNMKLKEALQKIQTLDINREGNPNELKIILDLTNIAYQAMKEELKCQ